MNTFLKENEILPSSIWESADGAGIEVVVIKVEKGWVYYSWHNGTKVVEHDKDVFSFQVRYKLKRLENE